MIILDFGPERATLSPSTHHTKDERTLLLHRLATLVARIFTTPLIALWMASGWRIEGKLPAIDKFIIIAVPHTTNWDYFTMMMMAFTFGRKPFVTFKDNWTKKPVVGTLIQWLGGIPIDRSKSTNAVQQLAERIQKADRMMLVFTPEGTRSYRPHWKTGFYYAALEANVPIVLGYPDYERKRGGVGPTLYPSGDIEADMEIIREFYSTHGAGKYPEKTNDIKLPPKSDESAPSDSAVDKS